jgi:hypothetical protein
MDRKIKKENPYYQNKTTLTVYVVLRALIIFVMVRALLRREYQSMALCGLSLFLMILPSIVSRKLKVVLPSTLEIIILLFIFAAEILGEINSFYMRVPHWDTMLHTINGFLCAAIGFCLVDMMNREERFSFKLSPLYLAIVSFCFSMTVGVIWEFFEFGADQLMGLDMQKDAVIHAIDSVMLDPTRSNTVIHIRDIVDTIVVHSDGTQEALNIGGYLDVGIIDTMKDLLVNFVGALVFSFIGFFYVKHKGKGKVANRFIPQVDYSQESEEKKEGE